METETVINIYQQKIKLGLNDFSAKFYQNFKKELMPILLRVFHTRETKGILPNSFHEAIVTLIPKPHINTTKIANYRQISLMNMDAKILKYWQTEYKNTSEKSSPMTKKASSEMQG